MPITRFHPRLLVAPAVLLTLSAVGVGAAATGDKKADAVPIRCEIKVTEDRLGRHYAARIQALKDVAGDYRLELRQTGPGGHAVIDQSGEFRLSAGDTETLGEATLGGVPGSVEAELTLNWNGMTLACRPQVDI